MSPDPGAELASVSVPRRYTVSMAEKEMDMNNGLNPWTDTMLSQLLICRLVVDAALKTCDPQIWVNVDAIADATLPRNEPGIDPFELHGRRRTSVMPQGANATIGSGTRRSKRDYGQM